MTGRSWQYFTFAGPAGNICGRMLQFLSHLLIHSACNGEIGDDKEYLNSETEDYFMGIDATCG